MGQSILNQKQMQNYEIVRVQGNLIILKKRNSETQNYIMKSYTSSCFQEHIQKLKYMKNYKASMLQTKELIKLVHIIQEKRQSFCSNDYKLHTIYQYSFRNLQSIIQQKQQKVKLSRNRQSLKSIYFRHEDLCNILYSCLTALWYAQEMTAKGQCSWEMELQQFQTIFLKASDILVFDDGVLKIMDPFLLEFQNRYLTNKRIYYSPEKIRDFSLVDDEKSSIFELGMTLLRISLLQELDIVYQNHQINAQTLKAKINKAKQLYKEDLDKIKGINIFELIQNMIEINREKRFSLENTIKQAEIIYEKRTFSSEIFSTISKEDFFINFQAQKEVLTTNSTIDKQKSSKNNFIHFKNSLVNSRKQNQAILIKEFIEQEQSPNITTFTIVETQKENDYQTSKILENQGIFDEIHCQMIDTRKRRSSIWKSLHMIDQKEALFTDPSLLSIISEQLIHIKQRKRLREERLAQLQNNGIKTY